MGLFNWLLHSDKTEEERKPIDRRSIPSDKIDEMQRIEASLEYRQKIYNTFYSDYPIKPFISKDREINTSWIEQAQMFPAHSIIPKAMLTRYHDGLLPGHIYMLYWLDKYTDKRIPSYFEYRYGIDFYKEEKFLAENGYLLNGKPTEKGQQAMHSHFEVIDERHPEPKHCGPPTKPAPEISLSSRCIPEGLAPGKLLVPVQDKTLIATEFNAINKFVTFALKLAGSRAKLQIDPTCFLYEIGYTFYESSPLTPTGKSAKYPLSLHYAYPEQDYFGTIYFLKDGSVGKAMLIFWKRQKGYMVKLGIINKTLSVKKVEINNSSSWETLYKA